MAYHIYVIENQLNYKRYVGQTNDPARRWAEHKRYAKNGKTRMRIHRAMAESGVENFTFQVIDETDNRTEGSILEVYWTRLLGTRHIQLGYNDKEGGNGYLFTEENRKNMSAAHMGIPGWCKGTKGVMKPNSTSFKDTIPWPPDDELITMVNETSMNATAKKLGVDISSLSHRIRKRNLPYVKRKHTPLGIGSSHRLAKLTEEQVLQIVELVKTHTQKEVAEMFGVSRTCISGIMIGRLWAHITGIKSKP
jgi:group I intron endonuclease